MLVDMVVAPEVVVEDTEVPAVEVDMVAEDLEVEDMEVEAVVAAEVVESFQLPSKLDTIFNTEMFHHLDLFPQQPSKSDQTQSHLTFSSDHHQVT